MSSFRKSEGAVIRLGRRNVDLCVKMGSLFRAFRRWSELPLTLIVVKAVIEGLHQEILDFEHYTSVCSKTGQGRLIASGH